MEYVRCIPSLIDGCLPTCLCLYRRVLIFTLSNTVQYEGVFFFILSSFVFCDNGRFMNYLINWYLIFSGVERLSSIRLVVSNAREMVIGFVFQRLVQQLQLSNVVPKEAS